MKIDGLTRSQEAVIARNGVTKQSFCFQQPAIKGSRYSLNDHLQSCQRLIMHKEIKTLKLPMSKDDVLSLKVGDMVSLNGRIVTGRDKLHKYLVNDKPSIKRIPFNLEGTILYHCGPIVKKTSKGFEI